MRNILFENFIIDPASELVPHISISPISIHEEIGLERNGTAEIPSKDNRYISVHAKCRDALYAALVDCSLSSDDYVTILTTSGNYYVSGCVTKTIERICRWNREIIAETKVILVIHEFGYAYQQLSDLQKYNMPIIEDCAHSFYTTDACIGEVGDYVIYSLPKAFNMQLGGLMYSKSQLQSTATPEQIGYIENHLSVSLLHMKDYIKVRKENFDYLLENLDKYGISPFFDANDSNVPGVFLFRWREDIDYPDLKEFMQRNGVESSVFYGKNAFFIPVHQNLTKKELDYIITLLKYYYNTKVK